MGFILFFVTKKVNFCMHVLISFVVFSIHLRENKGKEKVMIITMTYKTLHISFHIIIFSLGELLIKTKIENIFDLRAIVMKQQSVYYRAIVSFRIKPLLAEILYTFYDWFISSN